MMQELTGRHFLGPGGAKPIEARIAGAEIESGRCLAEANPPATLPAIRRFLAAYGGRQ